MLAALERGCRWVCGAMGVVAMTIVALLALPITYDATMRTFGFPTIWVFEVSLYALIAAGFLANPLSLKTGAHFRVTILYRLIPGISKVLNIFAMLMTLTFAILIVWAGSYFVHYTWSNSIRSDSLFAVPLWIPILAIPIGGLGLFLQTLIMLLTGEEPGEEADVVIAEAMKDHQR